MKTAQKRISTASFDEPWPEVLISLHEWISTLALQAGSVSHMGVHLSLSREILMAAKARGKAVQPAFDQFRQAIFDEWQISIPLPDQHQGLHDQGPHQITFFYWR